jgi:hypothetical protein
LVLPYTADVSVECSPPISIQGFAADEEELPDRRRRSYVTASHHSSHSQTSPPSPNCATRVRSRMPPIASTHTAAGIGNRQHLAVSEPGFVGDDDEPLGHHSPLASRAANISPAMATTRRQTKTSFAGRRTHHSPADENIIRRQTKTSFAGRRTHHSPADEHIIRRHLLAGRRTHHSPPSSRRPSPPSSRRQTNTSFAAIFSPPSSRRPSPPSSRRHLLAALRHHLLAAIFSPPFATIFSPPFAAISPPSRCLRARPYASPRR